MMLQGYYMLMIPGLLQQKKIFQIYFDFLGYTISYNNIMRSCTIVEQITLKVVVDMQINFDKL